MTTLANPRSLWDTLPVEIAKIITDLAAAPIILIQRMFRGAAVRRRVVQPADIWGELGHPIVTRDRYTITARDLFRDLKALSSGLSSIDPQGLRMRWLREIWGDRLRTPRYLGYTREQRAKIFWSDL